MQAPGGFPNTGNTCYISSTIQCLHAVQSFREQCSSNNAFEKVVAKDFASREDIVAAYQWCRALMNIKGASQEDPAELLCKLYDKDLNPGLNTSCFENMCTKRKRCTTCGHTTETSTTEKMLIVTSLPSGSSPVQRAVDAVFGFKRDVLEIQQPVLPAAQALSAPANTNAPPMAYRNFNRGFTGSSSFAANEPADTPSGEIWFRCDDESVVPVRLSNAQPYVLFYEERQTAIAAPPTSASSLPEKVQTLPLDCDEGACKSKQVHETYVCSYEISTTLCVHVAVPRFQNMDLVERTLLAGCASGGQRAYDLVSFISRVGDNHYVGYVRKKI